MARRQRKRTTGRQRRAEPAFVPEARDDVLVGVAVAALVAGIGVPTVAVWAYAGWGAMFGFLAVFGTVGGGMIGSVLTHRRPGHAALWGYTATGVVFAVLGAVWLLA